MTTDIYKRISNIENIILQQKAEFTGTIEHAYNTACKSQNEELAAQMARKLRDKLLLDSDKFMTLDSLNLDTTSIEALLASLNNSLHSDWALYRQALREIPTQEGFPFSIVFPKRPNESIEQENI